MCLPDHFRHVTRNLALEVVSEWYDHNIGKLNGDWEELRNLFYLAFFPISQIAALRQEILNFQQKDKETIGVA
jgi:hypothetical protein